MAGIVRIHINSDWKNKRLEMSQRLQTLADKHHSYIFHKIGMPLKDENTEVIECTKDEAMARYDWQEGIDCILYFANGSKATMQEKYLDYVYDTITFTEKQKTKPGNWYTCTAQYWFTGYARRYWTEGRMHFDTGIYIDFPGLHRLDAMTDLPWEFNENGKYGYEGITFRYMYFDDLPKQIVIARFKNNGKFELNI